MTAHACLTRQPLEPTDLIRSVAHPSRGAIILFLGVVREMNDGREVTGIEYSAYESMAADQLAAIAEEATVRFPDAAVALEHRLGTLELEEASVAIAVAHAHRDEAYAASRWVIEELKRRVPIWKREHYTDGTLAWVDPTSQSKVEADR